MDAKIPDELFDQYIEVVCDSEKENIDISKQPKVTKEQYEKIEAFYHDNNEDLIDRRIFNELWLNLSAKLNDVGPPAHTAAEWRRKWTVHKYNKKRKLSSLVESELDELTHSSTGDFHQKILEKLDIISRKQDEVMQSQNTMLNTILEKLKDSGNH